MSQSHVSVSTLVAGAMSAAFLFVSVLATSDIASAQQVPGFQFGEQPSFSAGSNFLPPDALSTRFPEIRATLEPADEDAALDAVHTALTQAGDGASYVWRRQQGRLSGAVRPTNTFRDASGQVCRHLEMMLTSGTYMRKTEGIACRKPDGVWELEG